MYFFRMRIYIWNTYFNFEYMDILSTDICIMYLYLEHVSIWDKYFYLGYIFLF